MEGGLLLRLLVTLPNFHVVFAVYRYGDVDQGAAFPCRCQNGCFSDNGTCLDLTQCMTTQPGEYRWQGDGCRIGNVAYSKKAYQHGQWKQHYPRLAVDGSIRQDGPHCAHPAKKPGVAWWYADLERVYEIHRVIIYNVNSQQYQRMRNFVIVVGNSTNMTRNTVCAEYNGTVPRGEHADLTCSSSIYGKYAGFLSRRTDSDKGAVMICEFVAMGRTVVDCGRCQSSCDDYNGCSRCQNGTRLPDCTRECPGEEDYGENCEARCSDHCANNIGRVCDMYNGTCLYGCTITDLYNGDWWLGHRCDVKVPPLTTKTITNITASTTSSSVSVIWREEEEIPADIAMYYGYILSIFNEYSTEWNKTIYTPFKSDKWYQETVIGLKSNTTYRLTIATYRRYVNGTVFKTDDVGDTRNLMARTLTTESVSEGQSSIDIAKTAGPVVTVVVLVIFVALVILVVRRRRSAPERRTTIKNGNGTHMLQDTSSSIGTPEKRRMAYENVTLKARTHNGDLTEPVEEPVDKSQFNASKDIYENYNAGDISDTAIHLSELKVYMEQKTKEVDWFKNEFEGIPCEPLLPCVIGAHMKYKRKNRFKNILPYDSTRVVLQNDDPDGYINANFITGYPDKEKRYIATQGPTKDTLEDFWTMVWQTKTNRIVMLTKLVENTKVKCDRYWPDSTMAPQTFGPFTVRLISEETCVDYSLRILLLVKNDEHKTIRHIQFLQWPDKSVPEHGFPLLTFIRKVRSFDSVSKGPTMVHCSAGVGRTGTYIAIDYSLEQAEVEGKIDIVRLLTHMRLERVNLIQTLSQYLFVHHVVMEATLCGKTAIPCALLSQNFDSGMHGDLQKQYTALNNFRNIKVNRKKSGLSPENVSKNRTNDIIPEDRYRPFLSTMPDQESNYINAVYVGGFKARSTMIATQMPMTNTQSDLWSLVYDRKCSAVVALDSDFNVGEQYWPDETHPSATFGILEVTFVASAIEKSFTCKELLVKNTKKVSENPLPVKLLLIRSWPISQRLPKRTELVDIIEAVEVWQNKFEDPTTLVQCTNGATKCGLFCASTYMIDKMKVDQEVDVFLAVRYISSRRPQFIQSLEQYQYLLEVAMEYMSRYDTYSNFQ